MSNHINLSFCIPTYNKVERVMESISAILSNPSTDIEVVVLDNGSTDNTLESLKAIKDKRLIIYENGENKGALFNMVNVLDKGSGKFLVYLTDQDSVNPIEINNFKDFLLGQNNLAGGYCRFNSNEIIDFEIFNQGYDAVCNIGYLGRHPTGYFFNRSMMKTIKHVDRFSDYSFVDLFPLEFVFAELGMLGNGAVYHRAIFKPETGKRVGESKSSTTKGQSSRAFFSPDSRLKMTLNYIKHIGTLDLDSSQKNKTNTIVFARGLISATFGYRSILQNDRLCAHYNMKKRRLKMREVMTIGYNFYTGFFQKSSVMHVNRVEFGLRVVSVVLAGFYTKVKKVALRS